MKPDSTAFTAESSTALSIHRAPRNFLARLLVCLALTCLSLGPGSDATATADPTKVIHAVLAAPDNGFDMAKTFDPFSIDVAESIFETLLTYDYLARPAKLVPLTAEALPEVSDGGKTYTFHVKKGIYFAADPAFRGKRRELTAQDYAYAIKRLLDPALRSPAASLIVGKVAGLDALAARAGKTGHFDYDATVAGIETPDRHTLRIHLNGPEYNFPYVAAAVPLAAVAREVIEAYGDQTGSHPVGTGPYLLKDYEPGSRIVLEANPGFRGFVWDFAPTGDPRDEQLIRDMKGKQMPRIGRVEITIIEEAQSRWLTFLNGQLDYANLSNSLSSAVLDGARLKPELAQQGISLYRTAPMMMHFAVFNMRDPILGGYTPEKIALRRAIAMSYDIREYITLLKHNQWIKAEMVVPEGVAGYDPDYRSSITYDPDLANRLLDHFGYRRGADGYRTLPDGKPLVIEMHSQHDSVSRQSDELWKRNLETIGLRLHVTSHNFAELMKAALACQVPLWGAESTGLGADYPDAENIMQNFYGEDAGIGNEGCYESPVFDALYRQLVATPPGPARNALVIEMNRQLEADSLLVLGGRPIANWLVRPWVKGFKKHPVMFRNWQYLDITPH